MMSAGGVGPGGGPRQRSRGATVALLVVGGIVLFGAGVALSYFLLGNHGSTPSANGPTTEPCVRTTTVPGVALPKPGTVSLNVYNATDRTGLAARTAAALKTRGFVIGTIGNDPLGKTITGAGELRYGPKGKQNALLLKYYIPGAVLVPDTRSDASVDVVLGNAFQQVRPQAAVEVALHKPVVTATGPGCPTPTAHRPATSASPSG